ncbi:MAG: hypothetical protein M9952_02725 [Microthrixaceae bacterium]|nr:hypothetical protein [Microthrixaceae bacterium]
MIQGEKRVSLRPDAHGNTADDVLARPRHSRGRSLCNAERLSGLVKIDEEVTQSHGAASTARIDRSSLRPVIPHLQHVRESVGAASTANDRLQGPLCRIPLTTSNDSIEQEINVNGI